MCRSNAELSRTHDHAQAVVSTGTSRQTLQRSIIRAVIDHEQVASHLEAEKAIKQALDIVSLVVGRNEDEGIARASGSREARA
jgi:hypothetical protein